MEVVDGKPAGGAKGRRVQASSSDTDDGFTPVGAVVLASEAKQVHRHKCILCKIFCKGNKRFGPGIHSTAKCPILKERGFTISYDYEKDQVLNPEGRPSSFSSGGSRPSAHRVDSGGSGLWTSQFPRLDRLIPCPLLKWWLRQLTPLQLTLLPVRPRLQASLCRVMERFVLLTSLTHPIAYR